eukprot:TRINITY_DN2252_c0_g1_i1.p1 TRINITY_DN2252_c0_g1~~TRINITY_DN2252_c0_g1_i1.p1  ORF type:complete len:352 (-),score=112.44 TRINITY_DN2252_c0_g1_i1:893-1948(-)
MRVAFMSMSEDVVQLLDPPGAQGQGKKRKHIILIALLSLFLILLIIGIGVYFGLYFGAHERVKVLSLNVWGLPSILGSLDKETRIRKIVDLLYAKPEFDLIFMEELWMPGDHDIIAKGLEGKYIMTEFEDMNPCIRLTAPWRCSGLAVLSKFPFQEVEFHPYNVSGFPSEEFIDGENLVNKGVGRVRVTLPQNVSADFYLTHTIADAPPGKNYTNDDARLDQIGELLFNGVNLSEADLVVLSGDFNTGPGSKPYDAIHRFMTSTALDILKVLRALFDPVIATYANPQNTWSWNISSPIMYDHIFYRVKDPNLLAWTNIFSVPLFHFLDDEGKKTSVSDHEGVTATLYYRRK